MAYTFPMNNRKLTVYFSGIAKEYGKIFAVARTA
jgi:hypothetical protein